MTIRHVPIVLQTRLIEEQTCYCTVFPRHYSLLVLQYSCGRGQRHRTLISACIRQIPTVSLRPATYSDKPLELTHAVAAPLIENGAIEIEDRRFDNPFVGESEYRGIPTPERENAWARLGGGEVFCTPGLISALTRKSRWPIGTPRDSSASKQCFLWHDSRE